MGAKKYLLLLAVVTGAIASATVIVSAGNLPLLARYKTVSYPERSPNNQAGSADAPQPHYKLEFIPAAEDIGQPTMQGEMHVHPSLVCGGSYDDRHIKIFMPVQNTRATSRTVSSSPTLFVYVPKNHAEQAEISILDEEKNELYWSAFALTGSPGIVKLSLPETVALEVGQEYEWYFEIICQPEDRSFGWYERGKLRRVALSGELKAQIEQAADPIERAKLYAKAKIWQEMLEIVATVREEYPGAWEELLTSVGLADIASQPFLDCCTLEEQSNPE